MQYNADTPTFGPYRRKFDHIISFGPSLMGLSRHPATRPNSKSDRENTTKLTKHALRCLQACKSREIILPIYNTSISHLQPNESRTINS